MKNLIEVGDTNSGELEKVEVEHNPTDHYLTIKAWDAEVNFQIIEGDETMCVNICDVDRETISNGEINKIGTENIRDFFITVVPLTTKQASKLAAESLVKNIAASVVGFIRGIK